MELSDRLKVLPPYVFAEIDKKKKAAKEEGRDIINLGVGDPDRPTPKKILEFIKKASDNAGNHQYPMGRGSRIFLDAVARWMKKRFGVEVNEKEILCVIGAKDGITHIPLAFVNPGDIVLVPDPGYPGYVSGALMAGGVVHTMPLLAENKFLPDLDKIPAEVYKKAKIMWLNYPNNPTSAMATSDFYEKAVRYAKKYDFIIAQDAPYCDTYFGEKPGSVLQVKGAKDVAVEFYSFSKSYNMTGWRIGYAVGGENIISGLLTVKENMDSGTVSAIQEACARVLDECDAEAEEIRNLYKARAELFYKELTAMGYEVLKPDATLYVWFKVPKGVSSMDFASKALEEADLVITPGIGFGEMGGSYARIALTVEEDVARKALERLKKLKF